MKNILIVDAHSTGVNFIDDATKRGYNPVVLTNKSLEDIEPSYAAADKKVREKYKGKVKFYDDIETYEETLKITRKIDPVCILTGCERGVITALRLSNDLGFPSNPYENLPYYIYKDKMQEACKEYGIRYIRSKHVKTLEEAIEFYRKENLKGCVLKPSRGGGSVGVYLCDNEEEMVQVFEQQSKGKNVFGEDNQLIMQERIYGTEYIVDTVSFDGVHKVVSVFKYKKRKTAEGELVHDYGIFIKDLDQETKSVIDYALKVTDAIDYKYGAIHGEYTVDEKGPVLIEVNCRVRGSNLPVDYLDYTHGHHETDVVLDMYLEPDKYKKENTNPGEYNVKHDGAIKFLSVSRAMKTASFPMLSIGRRLKTYFTDSFGDADKVEFVKTTNLVSCPGKIFLAGDDKDLMVEELMFLSKLNNQYERLCFEDEKDYKGGKTLREKIDDFYTMADKLAPGETFQVPKKIQKDFPYGEEGLKVLCEPFDLKLNAAGEDIICEKK